MAAHRRVEPLTPVIEITCDDQQGVWRYLAGYEIRKALHLTYPAAVQQAKVRDNCMHFQSSPEQRNMQQAALFERVVRHIMMTDIAKWPARQQGIAMLAMPGDGIGSVGDLIAIGRQEFGLSRFWPTQRYTLEAQRLAVMEMPHLLQKHQIGVQGLDAMPKVVDFQTLLRSHPAHSLVDVVGRNAQMLAFFATVSQVN